MASHCFVLIASLLLVANTCIGLEESEDIFVENDDSNTDEFIPANEWKTVKPGQALPSGLHVRLNMKTGEKEARLLQETEDTQLSIVPESQQTEQDDKERAEGQERLTAAMEEIYKKLQTSADSAGDAEEGNSDDKFKYWKTEEKIDVGGHQFTRSELEEALAELKDDSGHGFPQGKFRSMEELKDELGQYEVEVQTDGEIIQELWAKYRESTLSVEEKIEILEDLEYYLHQVDNARDFSDMGGFNELSRDLNHTDSDVRKNVAFVIGSAAQSNPPVQIALIELNIMQKLIQMLAQEKDKVVRQRVLYALSSLVRHFPYAQQKFLQFGGLQVLRDLYTETGDVTTLQLKALTVVVDLVTEQAHALENEGDKDDSIHREKLNQYRQVPIATHLQAQGWCNVIPPLLHRSLQSNHDEREKILRAMSVFIGFCRNPFMACEEFLDSLKDEYERLVEMDNEGDNYYEQVLHLVESLRSQLEHLKHSEL